MGLFQENGHRAKRVVKKHSIATAYQSKTSQREKHRLVSGHTMSSKIDTLSYIDHLKLDGGSWWNNVHSGCSQAKIVFLD